MGLRRQSGQGSPPSYSDLLALRELPESERPPIVLPRRRAGPNRLVLVAVAVLLIALIALGAAYFLMKQSPSVAAKPPIAVVRANLLNCRAQPSSSAPVVQVAHQHEQLVLRGQSGVWREVQIRGASCWVNSEHLLITKLTAR